MIERRNLLKGAAAALTTSLFTGRVKGANDRIATGHIGIGAMGSSNLGFALKLSEVEPVAVCDVYQPHLEKAVATASKAGKTVKAVKDFREILADKSIDGVCISTPDHWHAYMSVEACKAGKDVFVEKPASVYVEEGRKMAQAARKYNRVVQAGTMQRSGGYFKKAAEIVKSGLIGEVTFCHTWQTGATKKQGWGKPADGPVPAELDWDMWLGPAPKVPFNLNRWGVGVTTFPTFRYFWDYAGGAMTDWGVHLIDPIHQCFGEPLPTSISAMGDKLYVDDNVETPDTLMATFRYPKFLLTYESRTTNPMPMFGQGAATSIHGTEATLIVNRSGCWLVPNIIFILADDLGYTATLTGKNRKRPARESLVYQQGNGHLALRKGEWVFIDSATCGDGNKEPEWFRRERGAHDCLGPGALYNLRNDPAQTRNLYDAQPAKVRELKTLLDQYRQAERTAVRAMN